MADYSYAVNPAQVRKFLDHVQTAGVPSKVSVKYLESVGFKSKNDRAIVTVLKAIGFLDGSGTPTDVWKRYRNRSESRKVLGAALKVAYKALFDTFPDANRKDNEALRNFFSTHTSVSEGTLTYIVRTFKTLADAATFNGEENAVDEVAASDVSVEKGIRAASRVAAMAPAININIQLEIPATENATIYESLFAAMKKNLFS